MLQLDEYETYFLQNFQFTTILIPVFCKICNHEIVLQECKSKQKQFQVNNSYKTCEYSNKLSHCSGKVEENMGLSYIYLAVCAYSGKTKLKRLSVP